MSSSQVCRYVLLPTLGENLKEHYSSTKFKEEKKHLIKVNSVMFLYINNYNL